LASRDLNWRDGIITNAGFENEIVGMLRGLWMIYRHASMLGFVGPSSTFISDFTCQKFGVLHCSASHAINHRVTRLCCCQEETWNVKVFTSKTIVSFPENHRCV
jgi:hypothetical protein